MVRRQRNKEILVHELARLKARSMRVRTRYGKVACAGSHLPQRLALIHRLIGERLLGKTLHRKSGQAPQRRRRDRGHVQGASALYCRRHIHPEHLLVTQDGPCPLDRRTTGIVELDAAARAVK